MTKQNILIKVKYANSTYSCSHYIPFTLRRQCGGSNVLVGPFIPFITYHAPAHTHELRAESCDKREAVD